MAPLHDVLHVYGMRSRGGDPGSEELERDHVAHPLLKSWNLPANHSFSKSQMRTLTSICDAFSPSIIPAPGAAHAGQDSSISFEDMSRFYGCSASDMGAPEDIACLLTVLLKPMLLMAVKVVLWLLSTGLGSVLLGGRACLTWRFPFCHGFPALPRSNQETILRGWSLSAFASLRALCKLFKMITVWVIYTKIEKDGSNRNWKAIGYCGADPDVTRKRRQSSPGAIRNPLKEAVIQTPAIGANLAEALNQAGVTVLDDIQGQKSAQTGDVRVRCDVVVVGSGSGGGVAACVLAEAGYKVVIVEKGKYFTAEEFSTLEGPSQMAMYERLGSLATQDGGVNLVAGATVGGGSAINWSACLPTPLPVLREWGDVSGLELFTSARYQLALSEVWRRLGAQSEVPTTENLPNSMLRSGCERLGWQVETLARNTPPGHDCGWCGYGCPRGQKGSTAATWLVDAVKSGNAIVMAECEAQAVLYSKNQAPGERKQSRAQGVVARVLGSTQRSVHIEAKAVVVASGSLLTPPLLLTSGLRNPNIGKGLHLHPVFFLWGYFPQGRGPPTGGACYEGAIMTAYSPIYEKGGSKPVALLECPSTHPGSFASFQPWTSDWHEKSPHVSIPAQQFLDSCYWPVINNNDRVVSQSAADFKERMARFSRTVTLCVVIRDESSGQVSVEADGTPVITYTLNAADEATALEGIERGLRVLIAAGAAEVGTHQQDGERFSLKGANPSDIEAYIRRVKARGAKKNQISMGSGHQMSSCRMGSSPKHSVVNGDGETWEVEGLYVSDASVLPSAVGVNPMVTIQTLAYCTAQSILKSLQSSNSIGSSTAEM